MIRRSDVILSFGLVALCGSIVVLLFWPAMRRERQLRSDLDRLQADLVKPASGPEMIERLERDIEALRAFGSGRMTPIPENSNIAGLMASLSQTLDDLSLEQHDITTRPPKLLEYASSMPVSLTLSGPFPSIYRAVAKIESMDRLVRVDRLRITVPRVSMAQIDRSGRVLAEISISAFFKPRDLSAVDAEEDGP